MEQCFKYNSTQNLNNKFKKGRSIVLLMQTFRKKLILALEATM
jgi:hypothetical protein